MTTYTQNQQAFELKNIADIIVILLSMIFNFIMRKFDQLNLYYLRCTPKHEKITFF
jgi:hypothetical protein